MTRLFSKNLVIFRFHLVCTSQIALYISAELFDVKFSHLSHDYSYIEFSGSLRNRDGQ